MAFFTSAQEFFVSNSQSKKFELIQKSYVPRALRFLYQGPTRLREAKRAMGTRMLHVEISLPLMDTSRPQACSCSCTIHVCCSRPWRSTGFCRSRYHLNRIRVQACRITFVAKFAVVVVVTLSLFAPFYSK